MVGPSKLETVMDLKCVSYVIHHQLHENKFIIFRGYSENVFNEMEKVLTFFKMCNFFVNIIINLYFKYGLRNNRSRPMTRVSLTNLHQQTVIENYYRVIILY